ncbi:MAG: hypothetical protein HY717_20280 [Planctomycetes bacterium]|nr:hypothetical protein [Planctomycetota bacterium]
MGKFFAGGVFKRQVQESAEGRLKKLNTGCPFVLGALFLIDFMGLFSKKASGVCLMWLYCGEETVLPPEGNGPERFDFRDRWASPGCGIFPNFSGSRFF